MNDTEKQKISNEFEKWYFENLDNLTVYEHTDYWLSILDKTIKSKLEAVEGAVKEVSLGEIPNYEEVGSHFGYDEDIIEIINKHK